MGQVGKIKRLIGHKLVAGKRIPSSQLAILRFHDHEIIISHKFDGNQKKKKKKKKKKTPPPPPIRNQSALHEEPA